MAPARSSTPLIASTPIGSRRYRARHLSQLKPHSSQASCFVVSGNSKDLERIKDCVRRRRSSITFLLLAFSSLSCSSFSWQRRGRWQSNAGQAPPCLCKVDGLLDPRLLKPFDYVFVLHFAIRDLPAAKPGKSEGVEGGWKDPVGPWPSQAARRRTTF